MITTKEIYFTVEDVFNLYTQENIHYYPKVELDGIDSLIYYRPPRKEDQTGNRYKAVGITKLVSNENKAYINNVLRYIELYLKDYSCFKIEVAPHEEIHLEDILMHMADYNYLTYPERFKAPLNAFSERFAAWIDESIEIWIPKFKIYENFDYSEFLTNPDKVITKEDISTPRVARSRLQVRKVNDTPEEVGDFTGDGYVNQIEFVNNTDNAPTGTDEFSSTVTEHDVEKTLRILNECLVQVRNLYRQWMIDFRRKVLID